MNDRGYADDPGPDWLVPLKSVTRTDLPDRETQWGWLLELLAEQGEVRQVMPGRIEVDIEQSEGPGPAYGPLLTVVLTAAQWEDVLLSGETTEEPGSHFGDLLGLRDPEENFAVFYEGSMCMSTREELPPVEGRGWERWLASSLRSPGP